MDLTRFEQKKNVTERGELLTYFSEKLSKGRKEKGLKEMNIKRVAFMLTGIDTKDMYYIKSVCDDWESENKPWGSLFWTMLKNK